jgi:hypothetical protein
MEGRGRLYQVALLKASGGRHLSQILLRAISGCIFVGLPLWAQTPDHQTEDGNKSWTSTTESQSDNVNPTRTTASHSQSGNRKVDKESVQRRGLDGNFEPYQDVEKESVQVNAETVRTVTRTFGWANGTRTLLQVVEEEKRGLPGDESKVVRATSSPDVNGNLQLVQREIEETKKTGNSTEETKTTVMRPDVNGGLAPAMQVQERRTRGPNDTVESQKTTMLPDGSGNWQVSEKRQTTTRQESKSSSSEERVSRIDSDGKLHEVSRSVSKASEGASGEKRNTVESYSVDVPGSSRDGSLHLVERATTTQRTTSTGEQITEQQVEQSQPGDPSAGLRITTRTSDTVRPKDSGSQATRTVQVRDVNGSLGVVFVDTTKSDNVHTVQVQITPSEKPK